MSDEQIIALIDKELREKSLAVTEQYLEIHTPVYINQKVSVERIDRSGNDEVIIAYIPVVEASFYLAVCIDSRVNEIFNIYSGSCNKVYFHATSELLSEIELKSRSKLMATDSCNKGNLKRSGRGKSKYSYISFLPNPEPDGFEDKLRKLLDYLEQDKDGVNRLVNEANGYIQVTMNMHNANGMIGGPAIDRDTIKRMSDLGLGIDFDLYVEGNPFREHN